MVLINILAITPLVVSMLIPYRAGVPLAGIIEQAEFLYSVSAITCASGARDRTGVVGPLTPDTMTPTEKIKAAYALAA